MASNAGALKDPVLILHFSLHVGFVLYLFVYWAEIVLGNGARPSSCCWPVTMQEEGSLVLQYDKLLFSSIKQKLGRTKEKSWELEGALGWLWRFHGSAVSLQPSLSKRELCLSIMRSWSDAVNMKGPFDRITDNVQAPSTYSRCQKAWAAYLIRRNPFVSVLLAASCLFPGATLSHARKPLPSRTAARFSHGDTSRKAVLEQRLSVALRPLALPAGSAPAQDFIVSPQGRRWRRGNQSRPRARFSLFR